MMRSTRSLVLAAAIGLAGCASAHPAAPQANVIIVHPDDPASGAWKGSWHSVAEGSGHHASVSIVPNPNAPTYTLRLQLSRVEALFGGLNVPDVALQQRPDGTFHFEVKIPITEGDSGTVIQAMKLQGNLNGDTLVINYSTNDALKELDRGEIDLHRVSPPPEQRS